MAQIQRVNDAKLHEFAEILLARLGEEYEKQTGIQLVAWLRRAIIENTMQFTCSDNAIHLSELLYQRLLPTPKAENIFTICRDPKNPEHVAEAKELLKAGLEWARRNGANVMYLENITDIPHAELKEILPTARHLRSLTIPYAMLDRE